HSFGVSRNNTARTGAALPRRRAVLSRGRAPERPSRPSRFSRWPPCANTRQGRCSPWLGSCSAEGPSVPSRLARPRPGPRARPGDHGAAERTAFLAGRLSEDEALQFTTALAASGHPGAVLFDSPASARFSRAYLEADQVQQLVAVGALGGSPKSMVQRYGVGEI